MALFNVKRADTVLSVFFAEVLNVVEQHSLWIRLYGTELPQVAFEGMTGHRDGVGESTGVE